MEKATTIALKSLCPFKFLNLPVVGEKQDALFSPRPAGRRIAPPGFTGKAPGGPSRWSTERSGEWEPVKPKIVVEVRYDQVTGGRFRHGTKLVRFRPDKAPRQCTFEQIEPAVMPENFKLLLTS